MNKTAYWGIVFLSFFSVLFTVATVNAFTIDAPDFVFVGSHGGNVSFARSFTTSQWGIVDTLTGLYDINWLGITVGRMGFDADTGVAINITYIRANQLTYTPTFVAGGIAYIQKPDAGEPTSVEGGTYTWSSITEISTITATASGAAVTVRWDPEQNSLLNNLLTYISIAALIPMVAGAVYLVNILQGGAFDPKVAIFIAGLVMAFVVVAAIISSAV